MLQPLEISLEFKGFFKHSVNVQRWADYSLEVAAHGHTDLGQFICTCQIMKLCIGAKSSSVVILKIHRALSQFIQKLWSIPGKFTDFWGIDPNTQLDDKTFPFSHGVLQNSCYSLRLQTLMTTKRWTPSAFSLLRLDFCLHLGCLHSSLPFC